MATPTTLYSKQGITKEELAPSTVASQVAVNDEDGNASNVEQEVIKLRNRINVVANEGIHFKGAVTSTMGLPTVGYKSGWQYIVKEAGTYAGVVCEVGDLVLCISDFASGSASNADWAVLQANLSGSVSGPESSIANEVAFFDGTSGRLIKGRGITVEKSVPADAEFTDHVYGPVTNSADGLMTVAQKQKLDGIEPKADVTDAANVAAAGAFMKASDTADAITEGTTKKLLTTAERTKLAGIATGAEVNQNAFSKVKIGNVTITADSKQDTLEIEAGEGITVVANETGDKVTIKEAYVPVCVVPSLDAVPENMREGGLIIVKG